jgi:hypothetical protein
MALSIKLFDSLVCSLSIVFGVSGIAILLIKVRNEKEF